MMTDAELTESLRVVKVKHALSYLTAYANGPDDGDIGRVFQSHLRTLLEDRARPIYVLCEGEWGNMADAIYPVPIGVALTSKEKADQWVAKADYYSRLAAKVIIQEEAPSNG